MDHGATDDTQQAAPEISGAVAAASRKVIKRVDWPALHQELWRRGTTVPSSIFDQPYAAGIVPVTQRNAERAWGRFLAVETAEGTLDPDLPPDRLVTVESANRFVGALIDAGNKNNSIVTRVFDLIAALRIMQPDFKTAWLSHPGGISLRAFLPTTQRSRELVGSRELYHWGFAMMEAAAEEADPVRRASKFRNGLIIAVLASRAPRIRNLTSIAIGQQLRIDRATMQLAFGPEDMKVRKPLEYDLPPSLVPCVHRYLETERPIPLNGQAHTALWIGEGGKPFGLRGIEGMIRRAWMTTYGLKNGTHQFRHELSSAFAETDPETPGKAAALLGNSIAVAERVYTHVRNTQSARKVNAHVEDERERTRLLAQRLFGEAV